MLPRHFRYNGAWLLAFQHDPRLGFRRPTASSADTRNHLNAPQIFRHALLTLKRMVVPITKSMLAHGQALWPCLTHAGRWEGITAFAGLGWMRAQSPFPPSHLSTEYPQAWPSGNDRSGPAFAIVLALPIGNWTDAVAKTSLPLLRLQVLR